MKAMRCSVLSNNSLFVCLFFHRKRLASHRPRKQGISSFTSCAAREQRYHLAHGQCQNTRGESVSSPSTTQVKRSNDVLVQEQAAMRQKGRSSEQRSTVGEGHKPQLETSTLLENGRPFESRSTVGENTRPLLKTSALAKNTRPSGN